MKKIFLFFAAVIAAVTVSAEQSLYLKLSADWAGYTDKFAAYYFNSDTDYGWSDFMTAVAGKENTYTTTIPDGYANVIFVRLMNVATETRWDNYDGEYNVWSQTVDLVIPTDGKNLFTITSTGTGKTCTGEWSVFSSEPDAPVDSATVYFVNIQDWTTVNVYVFESTSGNYANYKAWPGEMMHLTAEQVSDHDVYTYTFPASFDVIIFNNGTDQTPNLTYSSDAPYYADPSWYASLDAINLSPAKFYITGDSALMVAAGIDGDHAWWANAIRVDEDSYTFANMPAGFYKMKVVPTGSWEGTIMGFDDLSEVADGLFADDDRNVCFTLEEAGDVVVTYKVTDEGTIFTLTGNFAVPCADTYGILIGDRFVEAYINPANENEYMLTDIYLVEGDIVQVYNACTQDSWIITNYKENSYQFEIEDAKYKVTESANYDFYFTISYGNDAIYIEKKLSDSLNDINAETNATMYNILGQKVADDYKGIVIIGGKKMLKR